MAGIRPSVAYPSHPPSASFRILNGRAEVSDCPAALVSFCCTIVYGNQCFQGAVSRAMRIIDTITKTTAVKTKATRT